MSRKMCKGKAVSLFMAGIFVLGGCSGRVDREGQESLLDLEKIAIQENQKAPEVSQQPKEPAAQSKKPAQQAPEIIEEDWSAYFDGLNGTAVIYDPSAVQYTVYQEELAMMQSSPYSTFKIISSLIALENGVIDPEDTMRTWSGETFWNEKWNRDLEFTEAFRESCAWYFRQVADEIGEERMQEELDRLQYGNCDISDWEGRLNTNNGNRALTGFWLESSLKISPKEQTEVMERIFGENSVYSVETLDILKQVMLVQDPDSETAVYGKTGMGKAEGVVADAWFTGFAEKEDKTIYYCVHLGRTDEREVSSALAREIALRILADYSR